MGRTGGQGSGEPCLGPDLHKPCLPITPVSPLLSGPLLKPLLKVFQDAGAEIVILLILYPCCLLPSSSSCSAHWRCGFPVRALGQASPRPPLSPGFLHQANWGYQAGVRRVKVTSLFPLIPETSLHPDVRGTHSRCRMLRL